MSPKQRLIASSSVQVQIKVVQTRKVFALSEVVVLYVRKTKLSFTLSLLMCGVILM